MSKTTIKNQKIKVNFEGSLFVHHSLGMVNRELLCELIQDPRLDIRHIPYEPDQFIPENASKYASILSLDKNRHSEAAVHIRHRWPPDFNTPASGKFILIQPWEYGSLPVQWCEQMNTTVDEIWVYTSYLKLCYIRSGIPPEKIQVIPCGIDPLLFHPGQPPSEWIKQGSGDRYCFLFNGGTTLRKGIDVLINAYLSEFRADEPVCLVIKDSQMYGKALAGKIIELSKRDDIASILYISENIDQDKLPGLYTACDCYVHPYRAEGYGLPIAEAIACGKPVIITGGGSCLDFVEPDQAFFVKCSCERMKEKNVSGMETVDYPFWLVPDIKHLQSVMRYVYNNKYLAAEKGSMAGKSIRSKHTWKVAASRAVDRIVALNDENNHLSRIQLISSAEVYMEIGNFTQAKKYFEQVLQLYGEDSAAYQGMGIVATETEKYEDACEYFRRADLIQPASPEILFCWYTAAKKAGKIHELRAPLRRACEVHTSNIELKELKEIIE